MTVSPWLTFEKLKELDSRVDTVETSGLDENPPGTTIVIDDVNGDDANDGFTAPVLTPARATEIARQYNWTDQDPQFDFFNFTDANKCDIDASGIVGGRFFSIRLSGSGPFTSGTMNVRNFGFLDFGRFEVDGTARVAFFNCQCVRGGNSSTPFQVSNALSGSFIQLEEVGYFASNNSQITDSTLNSFVDFGAQCDFITLDFDDITNSTFTNGLVESNNSQTSKVTSINLENTIAISLTGRKFNLPEEKTYNLTDLSSITESVPSIYSASTSLDGTTIRGDFADDTAAGAGGVQSGHLYYNTTNNNLDRKA